MHSTGRGRWACARVAWLCACLGIAGPTLAAEPLRLQVLHWWTSAGERKAADVLASHLAAEGIQWKDAAIPGGAGLGAAKVLRGRVLAGDAPEVSQMIGVSIADWAELGLLLEIDGVASAGNWSHVLFPTVDRLVRHRRHVVAAPLGIHRVNTLFYNVGLLRRHQLQPPRNWEEFERVAQRLQVAGVVALAQSSEPWQVATLFENLVLASGGPQLHRDLFVRGSSAVLSDPHLLEALLRLRRMKAWMGRGPDELPWTELVGRLARGEAAMLVMGDWAKGELLTGGVALDEQVGCVAMPGTDSLHLYSVDTLTMFAGDYSHMSGQERMARLLVTPAVQSDYNAAKGSVSVRRDAEPRRMDSCARASWQRFAQGETVQVPSVVHRMATDEVSRDALVAEIHRYFTNDKVSAQDVQRRMVAIFRALPPRPLNP